MNRNQSIANTCNGVDLGALQACVTAVNADSNVAQFQFRAENTWMNGGHNRSSIQAFSQGGIDDKGRLAPFVLDADEPPALLGADAAANPVEYVLHALAGCLTTTMVYHAAARGIAVDAVESKLEGDLDLRGFLGLSDDVRKGFRQVRVRMRAKSAASPEALAELTRFSPVYEMVSRALPVEVAIETY